MFFQGSRYKSVSRAMIFTQGLLAQSSKRNTPVPHHRQRYDVSCLATQSTVEGLSSRSQACSLSFGRVVARVGQYRLSTAPAALAALGAFCWPCPVRPFMVHPGGSRWICTATSPSLPLRSSPPSRPLPDRWFRERMVGLL